MTRGRDPDWWSQFGMLLMPFAAFAMIFLLTQPRFVAQPRPPPPPPPTALAPPATPASEVTSVRFANMTPSAFMSAVDRMASTTVTPPDTTETAVPVAEAPATPSEAPDVPSLDSRVFVAGLISPDGLALDPRSGNIYVSEEDANRIVVLSPKGQRKVLVDEHTWLYTTRGLYRRTLAPLKSPEGLAVDGEGTLYAVEDHPGGRVLVFHLNRWGRIDRTEEIPLPGNWQRFAWESIAVRDTGEILLAGSSAESALGMVGAMFQGAILYRDRDGSWWAPQLKPATSFSAVTFSKDGHFAVYADEFAGTIGWIDLQSRNLREGASRYSAKTPEGIEMMPDGRLLVVEEGGRLLVLDPDSDVATVVADGLGALESACWDAARGQLLVTCDGKGTVLEFTPSAPWSTTGDRMAYARCQEEGAIRHIPKRAPPFLRPLLSMGGVADKDADMERAFRDLTRRMPIMAADASAMLLRTSVDVVDPVTHVQFVAFDPNRLRFDEPNAEFPVSAIILRTRSGQVFKTSLVRTVILTGNMYIGKFENRGVFELPIPFAFQANVGPQGHAVIHFTGLGRAPDVAVALNPTTPAESYMLVTYLGGSVEQYRLQDFAGGGADNWVVSLPPNRAQPWVSISPGPDVTAQSTMPQI